MWELFQRAGFVAWPLGFCSVLALGIILERLVTLARLKQVEDKAFMILQMALENGDLEKVKDPAYATAPITQVVGTLTPLQGCSPESLQNTVDIAVSMQRLRLRRYLSTLATIGSTAPFIGLFGTVLGVMTAFHEMGQHGLSSESMASGISEALSATALGLLVAIPAVIAYNYFLGRVQELLLRISGHAARLSPLLAGRSSLQEA